MAIAAVYEQKGSFIIWDMQILIFEISIWLSEDEEIEERPGGFHHPFETY